MHGDDRDRLKRLAAEAALPYVREGMVLGVGTGTTTAFFIELLARTGPRVAMAVPSSDETERLLTEHRVRTQALSRINAVDLYVDGADQVDPHLRLIKGRGGALTREKVLASAAALFVCIVDAGKLTDRLGSVPVPVEVVPAAVATVAARLTGLGGRVRERAGYVTDNGNLVLDVVGLALDDPEVTELQLDALAGVVENGIFARRPADIVLAAGAGGVRTVRRGTG